MENDYRITKLHGTLIGDNRIPDLPVGKKTKIFSSTNGKTAWVDLPDGGEIEVIDGTVTSAQGNETEFTIETEPKGKVFLLKLPIASILMSLMLPSDNTYCGFCFGGTGSFGVIVEAKTKTGAMLSISTDYWLNADSTKNGKFLSVVDGAPAWSDLPDGGELELIEVSNATINHDGSYTYTLPNKPTSNPYILKTVDSDGASYYLMTGDSDVSFGMRPIALTDSFFGGNFMVVSGTTATQRPTNFPPQPKSTDEGKVLTVNNGYPSWETVGGAIPVVEVTLHDGSITLPEAQTTNFIIHNETLGYMYVNNIGGAYSAIIPVGKDNSGNNQLALFSGEGTNLTLEIITLGSNEVIKSLPFPQTINSEKGYNLLYPIIDAGEIVYAGNAVTDNNLGNFRLMLGLSSNVVPSAQGEQEYCNFDCIVKDMGIGRMSVKKDTNNIPQFKSFTTWLPPVTANSESKALIVTDGNAKWTTTPRYEHTITIKNSAGKILWTQTMRNSSNTVVNSYTNLKTLFGEATYAGFGEYCQLDLRGGTEATDKLIKADGTEATLESLGAIVYTDVCFLPK